MFTPLQPEATGAQVSHWRLRAVRALALCSLLALLVPCCVALFELGLRFGMLCLILLGPLWLPYVWLIWVLRSNDNARAVKKALAVTIGFGALILILFSYLLVEIPFDGNREPFFFSRLLYCFRLPFLFAITTYLLDRAPDWRSRDLDGPGLDSVFGHHGSCDGVPTGCRGRGPMQFQLWEGAV
jgi:hypothetical protein